MAKAKTNDKDTGKAPASPPRGSDSYRACYKRFAAEALALPDRDVELCRADVRIAFANVKQGVAAACADPARVRRAPPELPLDDVLALPDLGRALVFASTRVTARPASSREVEAKLKVVAELREPMLSLAETLARRGLLPRDVVAEVRAGSGKYDMASDGMALAHLLYDEHADALRGNTPHAEEFELLREASEWLLDNLTPDSARRPAAKQRGEAEAMRDRLGRSWSERHADLRKIGYYLHGDAFEDVTRSSGRGSSRPRRRKRPTRRKSTRTRPGGGDRRGGGARSPSP